MLSSMLALLQAGEAGPDAARRAVAYAAEADTAGQTLSYALDAVRLLAPIARPPKILCSGVNYRGHLAENPGAVLPETPGFFSKLPTTVISQHAAGGGYHLDIRDIRDHERPPMCTIPEYIVRQQATEILR
jgi:2-keto-4-pentenoate hydratase/2-oxohepta-3-ene-1,7-dioic acid hydratase in catechol pathway